MFRICSGFNGACPWKTAHDLSLDAGDTKCPLCSADMLQQARASRRGQDLTTALRQLKERSAEAFAESLSRLDRFADQQVQQEFADRVEPCGAAAGPGSNAAPCGCACRCRRT